MKPVIWTTEAEDSFYELVDYLNEYWDDRNYADFQERIDEVISIIQQQPQAYPLAETLSSKGIRKAVLIKMVSIYYKPHDNTILILLFWHNSRNPSSLNL
ncbi:MAG: type II toxin-antitoxin system RelE/ParE family toxin [Pedobacter sp.]|jgi:plasmid stabilization system protein ParE|nr:MAG: type II toxin-antitoxin system RelE/ParE family toxin [Pedobacter sp.]